MPLSCCSHLTPAEDRSKLPRMSEVSPSLQLFPVEPRLGRQGSVITVLWECVNRDRVVEEDFFPHSLIGRKELHTRHYSPAEMKMTLDSVSPFYVVLLFL